MEIITHIVQPPILLLFLALPVHKVPFPLPLVATAINPLPTNESVQNQKRATCNLSRCSHSLQSSFLFLPQTCHRKYGKYSSPSSTSSHRHHLCPVSSTLFRHRAQSVTSNILNVEALLLVFISSLSGYLSVNTANV